jgi:hypothetical protein
VCVFDRVCVRVCECVSVLVRKGCVSVTGSACIGECERECVCDSV